MLLCGVIFALVVMPGVTDAHAQTPVAREIAVNLRHDFQVTIIFSDFVAGVSSADVTFRNTMGTNDYLISGGERRGDDYYIADFNTPITFTQFRDRASFRSITMEYTASSAGITGTANLIVSLNPASGLPPATVERPTYIPFLPSQGTLDERVTLKFSDYINTERPRSDYAINFNFVNGIADHNVFPVRSGTDPFDGDYSFFVNSNTGDIMFGHSDTNFSGTIPLMMTVTALGDGTHFIRPASGIPLLITEIFVVNIVITEERVILESSVDVSLPSTLQLNYKDFIPTDRPFSDWDVEITYDDRADFDNKLRITGGTDADNGDATFRFTSETITFARQNPGNAGIFSGSVPFSMKITTTTPHYVGFDTTISRSATFDVNLFAPSPVTPDISVSIIPSARGDIDLSGITDELDTFDELTITFDTTDSNITVDTMDINILEQGNFLINGLNSTDGPTFDVTSQTISFVPILGASGLYQIPYTAVNSIGAMSSGVMSIELAQHASNAAVASNAIVIHPNPIAANFTVTATQNAISTINFTTGVSDLKDDLDTFIISIVTDDSRVTGPTGVTSPASFFTFNGTDTIDNTDSLTVTTAAQRNSETEDVNPDDPGVRTVRFTPHHSTPIGEYTFPYTVIDNDGHSNLGDAQIAITVDARVNDNPVGLPITEPTTIASNVDINFNDAISDEIDVDDDLIVRFSFNNVEHRSIFVPSSSSATVDSTDSNLFTRTVDPVTFEFIAAPSATTTIELTYTVTDSNGGTSIPSSVIITYTVNSASTNAPPSADPIDADSVVAGSLSVVSVNFYDAIFDVATSDAALRVLFTPPSHLSVNSEDVTLNTNSGNYTLVNNPVRFTTTDRTVPDTIVFDYIVVDSEGLSAKNTVTFIAIAPICNSENADSDNLNFGILEDAQISDERNFRVTNTGNVMLDLTLDAEHWVDHSDLDSNQRNPAMLASSTAYAVTTGEYSSKTKFNITDDPNVTYTIDAIEPTDTQSIYLQLEVALTDDLFRGAIRQDIDAIITCFNR